MKFLGRKNILLGSIVAIVLYLLFRLRKQVVHYDAKISNVEPRQLWKFVSDFNNMKRLNPTLESFTVEAENRNDGHWTYRIRYTEHLSQMPIISNFAYADFDAKILSENTYVIDSRHDTCFLTSFLCVHTESSFLIRAETGTASSYTESITYECPAVFSSFCQREVYTQRYKIEENLKRIFEKRMR